MKKYLIIKNISGSTVARVGKVEISNVGEVLCSDLNIMVSTNDNVVINEQRNGWRPKFMSSADFNNHTTAKPKYLYDFETDEEALLFFEVKDYD